MPILSENSFPGIEDVKSHPRISLNIADRPPKHAVLLIVILENIINYLLKKEKNIFNITYYLSSSILEKPLHSSILHSENLFFTRKSAVLSAKAIIVVANSNVKCVFFLSQLN